MANLDAILKPSWQKPVPDSDGSLRCPECGGVLLYKHKNRSSFLGCGRYSITGCDYTSPVLEEEQEVKWQKVLTGLEELKKVVKGETK